MPKCELVFCTDDGYVGLEWDEKEVRIQMSNFSTLEVGVKKSDDSGYLTTELSTEKRVELRARLERKIRHNGVIVQWCNGRLITGVFYDYTIIRLTIIPLMIIPLTTTRLTITRLTIFAACLEFLQLIMERNE